MRSSPHFIPLSHFLNFILGNRDNFIFCKRVNQPPFHSFLSFFFFSFFHICLTSLNFEMEQRQYVVVRVFAFFITSFSLLSLSHPHTHTHTQFVSLINKNAVSWSSLIEGGEGSYLPNCQTTLVIALDALFLLFCIFINTTAYYLGRYKPSPPSTKELHAVSLYLTLAHPRSV